MLAGDLHGRRIQLFDLRLVDQLSLGGNTLLLVIVAASQLLNLRFLKLDCGLQRAVAVIELIDAADGGGEFRLERGGMGRDGETSQGGKQGAKNAQRDD
ncbi:hypothetical protein D3C76_1477870 [compost metagenome]